LAVSYSAERLLAATKGEAVSARGKLSIEEVALAFLIGTGMTLMAVAGGLGAAFADAANETYFAVLFWIGVVALIIGIALWCVIVRPWTQFDDINVPKDSGHPDGGHPGHKEAESPGEGGG
jgi:hypothetical protein